MTISSCGNVEGWLEAAMASVRSGETSAERFCGEKESGRWSERAQERGEEREAREERRGSSIVLVSTKSSGGFPELRREIE
jgi:hypothetical protein